MKEINIMTMQEGLHKLMGEDYSKCSGTAHKNGYMAFYHQRGLYSVEPEDSEIVSLVYARNPFEAIDLVDEFRRMKLETQWIDDIHNPLEPLKLYNALKSEIFKYEYRKEHKPEDINILDYTIIHALKHCLDEQLKKGR